MGVSEKLPHFTSTVFLQKSTESGQEENGPACWPPWKASRRETHPCPVEDPDAVLSTVPWGHDLDVEQFCITNFCGFVVIREGDSESPNELPQLHGASKTKWRGWVGGVWWGALCANSCSCNGDTLTSLILGRGEYIILVNYCLIGAFLFDCLPSIIL